MVEILMSKKKSAVTTGKTVIMSKRRYIDWLEKQVDDKSVIIMSQELTGECKVVKKRNEKTVTFPFAADSFKRPDCIGHFAYGKTPVLAIAICPPEECSDETLKLFEEGNKKSKKR